MGGQGEGTHRRTSSLLNSWVTIGAIIQLSQLRHHLRATGQRADADQGDRHRQRSPLLLSGIAHTAWHSSSARTWLCRSSAWPCRLSAPVLSRMVSANTSISRSRRRPACRVWTKSQKIALRPSPLMPACVYMPRIYRSILSSGKASHLIRRLLAPPVGGPGRSAQTSPGCGLRCRSQSQDSFADTPWRSPDPGQSALRCTNTTRRLSR